MSRLRKVLSWNKGFSDIILANDRVNPSPCRGITSSAREREVQSIAGVTDNGRLELAEVATDLRKVTYGRVVVDG